VIANRMPTVLKRAGAVAGLLALAASLVIASDLFGARESLFGSATPPPRPSAFSRVNGAPAIETEKTVLRSQPWWQSVSSFQGAGTERTRAFTIRGDAIQWRVKGSCQTGRLVVRTSATSAPLIDTACPGPRTKEATQKVRGGLYVTATGPWKLAVEQQVDVPLIEPPLPAMSAPGAKKVATGGFYRIDQVGKGRVTIYRLASGRYALRLAGFYVTPNVELEIRLSPLRAPRSTRQYTSAPAALAAPLDVTAGSMNFVLPRGVDPTRYRSVVIWCPLITSAYAAATLEPVG